MLAGRKVLLSYIGQCLFQLVVVERILLHGLLAEALIDKVFLQLQKEPLIRLRLQQGIKPMTIIAIADMRNLYGIQF